MGVKPVVAIALAGCGRIGFDPASVTADGASDGVAGTSIRLSQVLSPGTTPAASIAIPFQQTAGDFAMIAVYRDSQTGYTTVSDSLGQTWTPIAAELSHCTPGPDLRFWYTTLAQSGANTISVTAMQSAGYGIGAFVVELSGVSQDAPIEWEAGDMGAAVGTAMDAGMLEADDAALSVAVFVDPYSAMPMTPGQGWTPLAMDTSAFIALVQDMPVGPGTYIPTAGLPGGDNYYCWLGAAVVLRPS